MDSLTPAEIGRVWFEKLWNERDESVAHAFMNPDTIGYLEGDQTIVGPEAFLEFHRTLLSTIPDLQVEVIDTVGDGDDVCIHWKAVGSHTGNGMGFMPSGKALEFQGVTWFKIRDGKISGGRDFWNRNALLEILSGSGEAKDR